MSDYISAVTAHWFWWIGLVLTLEPLFQRLLPKRWQQWIGGKMSDVKLAPRWFALAGAALLVVAFFQAWRDEHRNAYEAMYGKDGKAEAWSKFNACDKDRAIAQQSMNILTGQLANNNGLLLGQQDTFNRCVLALGLRNSPERPKVDVQWATMGEQRDTENAVVSQTVLFVGRTNRSLSEVRHQITCPFPFKFRTFGLSQKETLTFEFESGQDSDRVASFSLRRAWRPEATLIIVTTVAQENIHQLGECTIVTRQ